MKPGGERRSAGSGAAVVDLIGHQDLLQVLSRTSDTRGALLLGGPGDGKSSILERAVARSADRMGAIRIDACPLTRSIEFGAVATALPDLIDEKPLAPAAVLARLTMMSSQSAGRRLIAVDDAHELDSSSAAAVEQLVRRGHLRLLATHDAEQPLAAWISALVQHGCLRVFTLRRLRADEIHELAELRLGGRCHPRFGEELWHLSEGNPLRAQLLLQSAQASSSLTQRDGHWRLTGAWPTHGALAESMDERLSTLPAPVRDVLDTLAIAGPLELEVLVRMFGQDALEEAEVAREVQIDFAGPRAMARLVDRLLAGHLKTRLLTTRRRRLAANAASALLETGARRQRDVLRTTLLQVEAGSPIEGANALHATQQALLDGDVRVARRLVEHVRIDRVTPFERALIVGQVAFAEGDLDEAEQCLREAESLVESEDELARVTIALAELVARGQGCFELAIDLVGATLARVAQESWQHVLRAESARLALASGQASTADEIARAVLEDARVPEAMVEEALVISAVAQVEMGRFSEVEALSRRVPTARGHLPRPPELLRLAQVEASSYAGDLSESRRLAELEAVVDAPTSGSWELMRAKILLAAGDVAGATMLLDAAQRSLGSADPLDHRWRAHAYLALALSQAGDLERLTATLDPPDGVWHPDFVARIIAERAAAWVPALQGDLVRSAQELRRVGLEALDHHHVAVAATTLHDAVRLGHPDIVGVDLTQIGDDSEGALGPVYAAHAAALVGGDRRALVEVAARFEDAGALLLAAEALNQAATPLDSTSCSTVERSAFRVAARMADRCPGASTPALLERPTGLTARQAEVARMAVHLHSDEIAERLSLSVRTVESHLEAAYQKLGIHRRSELEGLLGLPSARTD